MEFFTQLVTDPAGFADAHQLLLGQIGINSLLALSIYLTLSCGILSLGNVGFMAIGAYVSALLRMKLGVPHAVGLTAGAVAAGVMALPLGLLTLRLSGLFLAIATIGFAQVVVAALLNLPITGEGQGLINLDADPSLVPVYISLAVVVFLLWRLGGARLGALWRAIREDPVAAASRGVDVRRLQLLAFVLGALLAGYAGGMEAHQNYFVDPSQFPFTRAVEALVYAVLGGIGSPIGPVLGALILTSLPEIIRFAHDYRDAVDGAVLLAIVLLRPGGLLPGTGGGRLARWMAGLRDQVGGAWRRPGIVR